MQSPFMVRCVPVCGTKPLSSLLKAIGFGEKHLSPGIDSFGGPCSASASGRFMASLFLSASAELASDSIINALMLRPSYPTFW
jgi:hypothetical protein